MTQPSRRQPAPPAAAPEPGKSRYSERGFKGHGPQRADWPVRLRRHEVPAYLRQFHNVDLSVGRLAALVTAGGGPPVSYWGRWPYYRLDDLDQWVEERLVPQRP